MDENIPNQEDTRALEAHALRKENEALRKAMADREEIVMQQAAQCMVFMRVVWMLLKERKRDMVITDEEMSALPEGYLVEISGDKVAGKPALRIHAKVSPPSAHGKN